MSEHDEPTVARSTLWIDTSNETTTRSVECPDDCATVAFERSPLEPESTSRPVAVPAETAVLERSELIAAFEQHATSSFEPPVSSATRRGGSARALTARAATHALAFLLGGALAISVSRSAPAATPARHFAQGPRAASPEAPRAPQKAAPASEPARSDTASTLPVPSPPAAVSLSLAADALARGDYTAAHAQYRELARRHPQDAALAAIAALLDGRARARCEGKDGPCAP